MERMRKRLPILLLMTIVSVFLLAGCSEPNGPASDSQSSAEQASQEQQTEEPAAVQPKMYKKGDSVKTDIIKVKVKSAEFAIALSNSMPFGNSITSKDDKYLTPKKYDSEKDSKNPFVASKGHTLVALTLELKNLDRNSVELDSSSSDKFITITYKGETYAPEGFDSKGWYELTDDHRSVSGTTTTNLLIGNEGKETYRGFVDIPVEVDDLDDNFDLTVNLPKSNGSYESFTYTL